MGEASEKHRNNVGNDLSNTQKKILELLSQDAQLSAKKIAAKIGISNRNIESNIKKLKECGILIRHGSPKSGYWEIMK
ncbi:MAG: winged helix-turn-helix transcriptional regulator [Dorea sp.]|nr:winged helix-turn-helix transcriptional regulator [Dorea sp.]